MRPIVSNGGCTATGHCQINVKNIKYLICRLTSNFSLACVVEQSGTGSVCWSVGFIGCCLWSWLCSVWLWSGLSAPSSAPGLSCHCSLCSSSWPKETTTTCTSRWDTETHKYSKCVCSCLSWYTLYWKPESAIFNAGFRRSETTTEY